MTAPGVKMAPTLDERYGATSRAQRREAAWRRFPGGFFVSAASRSSSWLLSIYSSCTSSRCLGDGV